MSPRKLKREVENELSFLFGEFGAHFVPDESTDTRFTSVTVETNNLRLRINAGRGEYGASVSPIGDGYEWTDILEAIRASKTQWTAPMADSFGSLSRMAEVVRPDFARLENSWKAADYPLLMERLRQIKAEDIVEMKRDVSAELAGRSRKTAAIRQILAESDPRFEAAHAERINALFEVFLDYRWKKEYETKLRAGINEVLLPVVGPSKAIEVMNRLFRTRES